jgi:hypothetical protein
MMSLEKICPSCLKDQNTWFASILVSHLMQSNRNGDLHSIDHCIEMLRIDAMCKADVTPFFIEMEPTAPLGYRADFSVHQKCRNYEKLQQWTLDHTAIL